MLATYAKAQIPGLKPDTLSDDLENGKIVVFPDCPIDLPSAEDLEFLRQEMHYLAVWRKRYAACLVERLSHFFATDLAWLGA